MARVRFKRDLRSHGSEGNRRPQRGPQPRVLGLCGGSIPGLGSEGVYHDAAAILTSGGEVVAGVEEERLNRIKHTNRLPARSIRACLEMAEVPLADVDRIAYYGHERGHSRRLVRHVLNDPHFEATWSARGHLAGLLSRELGVDVDSAKFEFVEHHVAHAASAYLPSPFPSALVVTLDGQGDGISGTVSIGDNGDLTRILELPVQNSLGLLYYSAIQYLGYGLFDEYKVMGLAPYGDPTDFRKFFETVCVLESEGRFRVNFEQLFELMATLQTPRRAKQPMDVIHKNFAAALQETLERAALHLLEHYGKKTGLRHLCLAGGVALNSTLAGKILRSGVFDAVFVQPASHDAGCALGAALAVGRQLAPGSFPRPLSHVYWGRHIGERMELVARLDEWSDLVDAEFLDDLSSRVANLLANGAVVGWVQGRSEFGPRALGNRSILADPRPAENKQRINDLIKAREDYRPFAPAVLEEFADDYFEMTPGSCAAFMGFTVPVRERFRDVLAAVTHVDGTARLQTVSRQTNRRFWDLIESFRKLTGIPVLLNTSFNHNVEPIVDSVDDAITCFLTTGIDHLVVGDFVVTKRRVPPDRILDLVPMLADFVRLVCERRTSGNDRAVHGYSCEHTALPGMSRGIHRSTFFALELSDGRRTTRELLRELNLEPDSTVVADVQALWCQRLARFLPPRMALKRVGVEHVDGCRQPAQASRSGQGAEGETLR